MMDAEDFLDGDIQGAAALMKLLASEARLKRARQSFDRAYEEFRTTVLDAWASQADRKEAAE